MKEAGTSKESQKIHKGNIYNSHFFKIHFTYLLLKALKKKVATTKES